MDRRVDVLLIGGGVASVRCARKLRRGGLSGSIVLVGQEAHPPYNRPPLSKELLRDDLADELAHAEPVAWYERRDVELLTGRSVMALDADARVASLDDGTSVAFERALLATGAEPRRPRIPGAERAILLRTLDDARRIRSAARPGVRAVIIGGGFIGVEVASSLATLGVEVTIVELASTLWGGSLGPELAAWARERLEETGVRVVTDAAARAIEPDGVRVGGERLPAEMVIAGVGVSPREALAQAAGIEVDDGIVTDARHETSVTGIFAAGDAARVDGLRVEHWHAAREGGERAALAMLGQPVPPPRAPWVFSEVAGHHLDVVGWAPRWDALRRIGESERFVLAYLVGGRVMQLAVVDDAFPVEEARSLVERAPPLEDAALSV
ncbi:MAG: NAD(P)/FAD-dependent oxidoreductase [Candidatus Limnocylindria bacterium]